MLDGAAEAKLIAMRLGRPPAGFGHGTLRLLADQMVELETYEKADDPANPVVCLDEQPVPLIGETRVPIPATQEQPERVDDEYERKGTASIFLFAEPLSGFRQATARPRRTQDDGAQEVAQLLETRDAGIERITLVCDNLNTHTKGRSTKHSRPTQPATPCDGSTSCPPPSTAVGSTWRSAN